MTSSLLMLFVNDVRAAAEFYMRGLGAVVDHIDDDGSYGAIALNGLGIGLVANWHAEAHLNSGFRKNDLSQPPAGFEIWVEVDDVGRAYSDAQAAGATPVQEPEDKPWGMRVAHLRDPDGVLVEIASRT